jgi:hypothetical protein
MDDELRILHEAMVVKDRLRVLAELQATYWDELLSRGFEQGIAEQLMLEWSRHAYGMTFRAVSEPGFDSELDDLLGPVEGAQPSRPAPSRDGDPSSVPPGEPWLQLVQDEDLANDAGDDSAEADAA